MGPHLWVNLRLLAFSGLLFLVLKTAGCLVVAYFKDNIDEWCMLGQLEGRMFNRQLVHSMLMGDLQVHDDLQSAWWSWLREDSENINMHFHVFSHAIYKLRSCEPVTVSSLSDFNHCLLGILSLNVWHSFFRLQPLKVGRVKWSEAVGTQSQMPKTQSTQLRSLPFAAQDFANGYKTRCRTRNSLEVEKWLAGRFCKRPSFADVLEFTCNLWVCQSLNGPRLFSTVYHVALYSPPTSTTHMLRVLNLTQLPCSTRGKTTWSAWKHVTSGPKWVIQPTKTGLIVNFLNPTAYINYIKFYKPKTENI